MPAATLDLTDINFEYQQLLAGYRDENFKEIEKEFPAKIYLKSQTLVVEAENPRIISQVVDVLDAALVYIQKYKELDREETGRLCLLVQKDYSPETDGQNNAPLVRTRSGKLIFPKTENQKRLADAFRNNEIIFASGVAGTGKTYLAVAYAVDRLKREEVSKIILTRPAVEAGESLGFLPGDMKEKVDPYLRPLYDALNEMLGAETVERYLEKEVIEIAPLAFMRGRTLNDAVVILDEAQNTTRAQMKMFLTRMGRRCQMIVNGDVSQIDLIKKKDSGLTEACSILQGIDGIEIIELDERDVVRNPLVQKIIERYAQLEEQ